MATPKEVRTQYEVYRELSDDGFKLLYVLSNNDQFMVKELDRKTSSGLPYLDIVVVTKEGEIERNFHFATLVTVDPGSSFDNDATKYKVSLGSCGRVSTVQFLDIMACWNVLMDYVQKIEDRFNS